MSVKGRMCFALVVVAQFVLVIASVGQGRSQAAPTNERWDNGIGHRSWDLAMEAKDRKQMLSIWDTIEDDLTTEKDSLAGTYVKGGYSAGYFLRWSIRKGFVLVPYFDQNLITDFSYGKVTLLDSSRISLIPEKELRGGRGINKTPLEWGAIGDYLVPLASLEDFGNYQAGLGVFNEFNGHCCDFIPDFLCQKVNSKGSRSLYPVPPRFAHFIKHPIEGRITAVGKKRRVRNWGYQGKLYEQWMEKAILIPVRVDLGADPRVKRNMLFRLLGEPDSGQYLQIIRVGSKTSMGYVVRDVSYNGKETYRDSPDGPEKPLPRIKAGTRVTTQTSPR